MILFLVGLCLGTVNGVVIGMLIALLDRATNETAELKSKARKNDKITGSSLKEAKHDGIKN